MQKNLWLVLLIGAVAFNAVDTNIAYSAGATLPWFVLALLLSPLWWLVAKLWRKERWKWFQWLNVAAFIMILLFVARAAVDSSMQSMLSQSNADRSRAFPAQMLPEPDASRGLRTESTAGYPRPPISTPDDAGLAPQPPQPIRRIDDPTHFGIDFGDGRRAIIEGDMGSLRENMRNGVQNGRLGY